MHAQFLISPMESWGKAYPVGVFHLLEGLLNLGLCAAAKDDVFAGARIIVGTQDAFAEAGVFEVPIRLGIGPKRKIETAFGCHDLCFEEVGNILSGGHGVEVFLEGGA